jgi:hypothetical protein
LCASAAQTHRFVGLQEHGTLFASLFGVRGKHMHMRRGFLPAVTVVLLLSVWGCSRPSPTQTNQALNSQATSTAPNDATAPANAETQDASNVATDRGSNQVEVAEPLTHTRRNDDHGSLAAIAVERLIATGRTLRRGH